MVPLLPPGILNSILLPFPLKNPLGEPVGQLGGVSAALAIAAGQQKHVLRCKDTTPRDEGTSDPVFRGPQNPGERSRDGWGERPRWDDTRPSPPLPPHGRADPSLPPKPLQSSFVKGKPNRNKSLFFSQEAHKIYSTFLQTKVKKKVHDASPPANGQYKRSHGFKYKPTVQKYHETRGTL